MPEEIDLNDEELACLEKLADERAALKAEQKKLAPPNGDGNKDNLASSKAPPTSAVVAHELGPKEE